jgi:plastocyanin
MPNRRVPTSVLVSVVPVIAALLVFATVIIGSSSSDGAAAPRDNQVLVKDFAYSPDPVRVSVGTKLKVKNLDDAVHTLTANNDAFDTGELDGGVARTIVLAKAGRYAYHCVIHDYMTGVINVGG